MTARPFCFAFLAATLIAGVTGVALGLSYEPSDSHAWLSVLGIEAAFAGHFVRGLHRAAAEASIISGALAVAVALASTARTNRDRLWMGLWLLALALVVALIVTGNPLRNDNAGRFALSVEVNVLGTLPGIGGVARRALIGDGPDRTLMARLFARHAVLLPALLGLVLLAAYRLWASARAAGGEVLQLTNPPPRLVSRLHDLVAGLACVLAIVSSALLRGAPLGAPADLDSAFPARPAWYFQPLYLVRQWLPAERAPLFTLLALGLTLALLGLLLWPTRVPRLGRSRRNLLALSGLGVYAALCVYGSLKDSRDREVAWSAGQEAWAVERVRALGRANASLKLGARHALNADPLHRARALFSEHCANCHALGDLAPRDGVLRAPELTGFGSRAWVLSMLEHPDAANRFGNTPYAGEMPSVTRPPSDPALKATFSPMPVAEREAIADFLSAQAFSSAWTASHETGQRLVRERCTSCHLFAGRTDDDESRAPELSGWASPIWISSHILNPRSGRTYRKGAKGRGQMPSFGGVLSQEEVSLLVDLIRDTLPKNATPTAYQAQGDEPAASDHDG